jgi:predicted DCC family thiol-disulfide oxidoreductase YuxK
MNAATVNDTTGRDTLVFYDGDCPMCSRGFCLLKQIDGADRLRFVDINAPGFDAAAWPASHAEMGAALHARLPDGSWVKGMPAIRRVYAAAGVGWLMAYTAWPPATRFFDRAYAWVARHRLQISALLGLKQFPGA